MRTVLNLGLAASMLAGLGDLKGNGLPAHVGFLAEPPDLAATVAAIRRRAPAAFGRKDPNKYIRDLTRCYAQVHSPSWRAWAKLKPLA